jgi:mannosyltransferase
VTNANGWRWAWFLAIVLVALSIARDIRMRMWADELFTILTARQSNATEIVRAIREGSDGQPPLYTIAVHHLIPIVRDEALAVRLPSTLGFGAMLLGVFAFCLRRVRAEYALVGALLTCQICLYYATEGRSYGAVLGSIAWALVFWQGASEGERRTLNLFGLAFCLGLAIALHYYAVCILGPLLVAESARAIQRRKVDGGILAAMAIPVVVLALHYPLIQAGKPFTEHFWAPAEWGLIRLFYLNYLAPIAAICSIVLAIYALLGNPGGKREEHKIPMVEKILLPALCITPVIAVAVSKYTTHAFVDRYLIWAVIGFAVTAVFTLSIVLNGNRTAPLLLLCLLLAVLCLREVGALRAAPLLREGEAALGRLKGTRYGDGLILVPDSHVFIELSYYAPAEIRNRLVYPVRRKLELQYLHSDTSALEFAALGRRTKLHVEEYRYFLEQHASFIMVCVTGDYLLGELTRCGRKVTPIESRIEPAVWQVSRGK